MSVRRAIFGFLIWITVLAFPMQVAIEPSMVNALATSIVVVSSLTVLFYLLWSTALNTHPLSTVALLGFCFTSQLGALLVQTGFWTALSNSLYDPLYTFGTLALYQAVALIAHCVYRFFSAKRPVDAQLLRGFLGWLGLYKVPSAGNLWFMGCVGLCTFPFSHFQNVLGKIALGFIFLTWAPFLIPFFLREVGESYCNATLSRGLLIGYALAACLLGLALNTRAVMFQGVVTVGLLYLFTAMRSNTPVTARSILKITLLAAVLVAVAFPVSNLATAMAVARQWRGKVSALEMINTTFFVLTKPYLIAAYRAQAETASRFGAYDEHYIDNPLLNRLVTTKYDDNAFHFARSLTTEDAKAQLGDISKKFVWAGLPTPVLRRLGIPVVKDDIAYSMGDYLAYLSRGIPMGGHKIGSMFAQGIALFGPLFPFIYAVGCVILFFFLDLLTVRSAAADASLAALGMLQIWIVFTMGISYESLHAAVYFVFRNFEQMVLIYIVVFGLARLMVGGGKLTADVPNVPTWQRG
jgi:hypothetical protein